MNIKFIYIIFSFGIKKVIWIIFSYFCKSLMNTLVELNLWRKSAGTLFRFFIIFSRVQNTKTKLFVIDV